MSIVINIEWFPVVVDLHCVSFDSVSILVMDLLQRHYLDVWLNLEQFDLV